MTNQDSSFEPSDTLETSLDQIVQTISPESSEALSAKAIKLRKLKLEERDNLISAILAISLGVILALVILIHLASVIYINTWSSKSPEEIELGTSNINNTANTIYPFLTTLVTAATGYYFTTLNRSNTSDDN